MNNTYITIAGNVLNDPEQRQLERSGKTVVNFRIIANVRRFNEDTGQWYDAAYFRVRVSCWDRVADNVMKSVKTGDPLLVHGRITTKEWKTEAGEPRVSYELSAEHVGHDLRWGVASFERKRGEGSESMVDDDETASRVNGERTYPVNGTGPYHGYDESYDSVVPDDLAEDATGLLRDMDEDAMASAPTTEPYGGDGADDDPGDEELVGAASGLGGSAGRGRRRGR